MTWTLVVQIIVLTAACGVIVTVCTSALHSSIIDKRHEDDYKRKDLGL